MNINRLLANMDNMARTNDFSVNIFGPGMGIGRKREIGAGGLNRRTHGRKHGSYTIESGDTLTQIAANNNTTIEALMDANKNIKDANVIRAGDSLSIPGTGERTFKKQSLSIRGLRCTNINLPGRSFITTPHTEYAGGPKTNRIQSIDYEGGQVQMTFMCDSTFEDKNKIELWQRMIFDGAYSYEYYDNYVGHIEIEQEGRNKQPIYSVRLHEAFPSSIQSQTLDSQGGPNLQTFTCTFAFRTWSSNFNNQSGGLLGGLFNKISGKINTKIDEKLDDLLGF